MHSSSTKSSGIFPHFPHYSQKTGTKKQYCNILAEPRSYMYTVNPYVNIIIAIKRRSGINPIPPTVKDRD